MTMSKRTLLSLLAVLATLSLFAACTGGAPTSTVETGEPAAQSGMFPLTEATAASESAESDAQPSLPVVASTEPGTAAEAVDASGLPVGFTEEGRPYRGNPDAPVVLEEYSDFQCPYCARFAANTLPGLVENQLAAGDVKLVFYDYPLTNIHPQATSAANAARCAGEQGAVAYWAMHDRLFAAYDEWANSEAEAYFRGYGQDLGLDMAAFGTCLDENRYEEQIQADIDHGISRGVSSTPSFFLNGQPLIGAQPLEVFNQAIAAVASGETIAAAQEPSAPTVKPTPVTIAFDDFAAEQGDAEAPVTIVEYTDYQCPYCQRHAAETLPQIVSQMIETGRVHYVIKDFPLDNLHPQARAAAVAARCAGEQDAYWPMHEALFARQSEWAVDDATARDVFVSMANEFSLDADAFTSCLESGQYDDVIQANQDEGLSLGVTGTPSFFINGFPVSGAQPYELFDYAIGLAEEGTLADAYVQREQPTPTPRPSGPVEVNTYGAYSIGSEDAPVVVVEFTDFQCPFCSRHFLETYPQIKVDYVDAGKVRYVFKDFPLTSIHPEAMLAAQAARCAGDQGDYVGMHDKLFAGQQEWSGNPDAAGIFAGYATELGLDGDALRACLDSGTHETAVTADLEQGISLGVDGTPAFFINGLFVSGAQPYEVFQQQIEQLLAAQSGG